MVFFSSLCCVHIAILATKSVLISQASAHLASISPLSSRVFLMLMNKLVFGSQSPRASLLKYFQSSSVQGKPTTRHGVVMGFFDHGKRVSMITLPSSSPSISYERSVLSFFLSLTHTSCMPEYFGPSSRLVCRGLRIRRLCAITDDEEEGFLLLASNFLGRCYDDVIED
jgi:hypothetical protein